MRRVSDTSLLIPDDSLNGSARRGFSRFESGGIVLAHTMKWLLFFLLPFPLICNAGTITVDFPESISEASRHAGPGDVVYVKAGIYRENVRLTQSGTPANPIRFVAETPGTVII